MIAATEKELADIRKLLELLDRAPRSERQTPEAEKPNLVSLKHIDAASAALAVRRILGDGEQPNVRLAVDERTNVVVIVAPEKELGQIKRLLQALDAPK